MPKAVVEIEQSTADEITQWVSGIRSYASAEAAADWLEAVGMNPPNGGGEPGEIPDTVPGFDKVIKGHWDWTAGKLKMDTVTLGGIGCNGILICSFVPTEPADGVMAMISVTGYPANMGNELALCVSKSPGVLYEPEPACSEGQTATLNYCVGQAASSWVVELEPGTKYYINVAGRGGVTAEKPAGIITCVPDTLGMYEPDGSMCNFRLEAFVPLGHAGS